MSNTAQAMPHFGPPMGVSQPQVQNKLYNPSISMSGIATGTAKMKSHQEETIEWAKFCMWLRGYLSALEGKELTCEDSAKIMEKLATVDPDSQLQRIYDAPNPYGSPFQPLPPPPPTGQPPLWTAPQWTVTTTTTTGS
jgi:hypothetical protein